jgi:large subunit ribosomal protein L5
MAVKQEFLRKLEKQSNCMNRLKQKYQQDIVNTLVKEFSLANSLSAGKIEKIVVSTRVSDEQHRAEALKNVEEQLKVITGLKPKVTVARKSEAGFKIRKGEALGLMVTLRGDYMWEFLDKLVSIVLARMKDFQGVSRTAFDQSGNYNLGLPEQIIFPEIEYDNIDKVRGLQITIVTSVNDKEQSFRLLELLGMPFEKSTAN